MPFPPHIANLALEIANTGADLDGILADACDEAGLTYTAEHLRAKWHLASAAEGRRFPDGWQGACTTVRVLAGLEPPPTGTEAEADILNEWKTFLGAPAVSS